jgi:hypothetical protein
MTVEQWMATYAGMPTNHFRRPSPEAKAFYEWLVAFNKLVGQRWRGLTLLDLAERPYHDWFNLDGDTPEQALAEVIRSQPELDLRHNRNV